VFRFLSRLSGSAVPIDSSLGKKVFAEMAGELFDPKHAAEHNQAMMEMGALICKPKAPLCEECPFHMACHAYIYNFRGLVQPKLGSCYIIEYLPEVLAFLNL
jgi:A/G-specific adenine glycosylase